MKFSLAVNERPSAQKVLGTLEPCRRRPLKPILINKTERNTETETETATDLVGKPRLLFFLLIWFFSVFFCFQSKSG